MIALTDLLLDPAGDDLPDAVLVHDAGGTTTRAELTASAFALRAALRDAGVEAGTAVAVMLGNRAETVAALFGVWALGAVYVPVNPRLTDPEITKLVEAVDPAAIVTTGSSAARFPQLAMTHAAGFEIGVTRGPARTYGPDVALVQTTSGTTGPPRPVPLRHSQILALLDGVLTTVGSGAAAEKRAPMPNLVPVSLSLWAGIYTVCFAFRVGAPVVLMDHFDPIELARLVGEHGIRSIVLPPAAMAMCCDEPALTSLAPLRYVRSITAPLSPFLARRFHDRFQVAVLNGYGQTELGGEVVGWSASDWRAFGERKLGAVGRPHAGVEVRTDETGELWVRTPSSTASSGELADRIDDERWLRTGDHARIDDDGFVWIEGRASDVINRGGLKVFPTDVEEVLQTADGVRDVAVVGVPDARLGEVPIACVVGDVGTAGLEAHCREHLAPYKVPTRFVEVTSIPRNEVGKILRAELARSVSD